MNLPIRPEAPPLDKSPDFSSKNPVPRNAPEKGAEKPFSDVLSRTLSSQSENSDEPEKDASSTTEKSRTEKKKTSPKIDDAWTLYGSAPVNLILPNTPAPITLTGGGLTTGTDPLASPLADSNKTNQTMASDAPPTQPAPDPATVDAKVVQLQAPDLASALKESLAIPDSAKPDETNPDQQKVPPPTSDQTRKQAENADSPLKTALKGDGTPVAQGDLMLRAKPKQDENASSNREKATLPLSAPADVAKSAEAKESISQSRKIESFVKSVEAKEVKVDFTTPDIFEVSQKVRPAVLETADTTPIKPANIDGVISTIHENVRFLRGTGSTHVELIYKPDQDTQLYLQVSKVNGEIQVQVRCERGDAARLGASWGEVQGALAAHGIRVEPLQNSSGTQDFLNFSGQNSRQQQGSQSESRSVLLDQLLPLQTKTALSQSAVRQVQPAIQQGWQSWA